MIVRRRILVAIALLVLAVGCWTQPSPSFPNLLRAADGTPILLEDVEAIVTDVQLTADEKRQQLRDLGIEDEELIIALLGAS